ncbi:MAG TPA: ATP-binding protein [Armatimonadota bacterium]|jgi:signal transduction histidine kinase
MLLNLVSNAYEALPMGRGPITISTGVVQADAEYLARTYFREELPEGPYSYLEVADKGSGMDEATLARLFDPFFNTRFTGRGLGMAAVLGTVRGHKGAVRARSQPGEGTCVRVLLPWMDHPAVHPGLSSRPLADGQRRGILVADDDPTVLDVVRTALEGAG